MSFSSAIFVFAFLPITMMMYYLLKDRYKRYWLLLCSVIFYGWAQPQFLGLLILAVFVDYIAGVIIGKGKFRRLTLVFAILANLVGLLYFKYLNFFGGIISDILGKEIKASTILLPIGISFYSFKGISYVADVYNGKIKAEKNIINVAIYICMYPQIMSGPLDRYDSINRSMNEFVLSFEMIAEGIERFIYGLAQKVIVADTLGVVVDDIWLQGVGALPWIVAWIGSIAYTLQIYYDFAGYSNMAIGIGKMLGFNFQENFDLPYTSVSVTEFWRRWHISLGNWFKDYVYIPLGGSKKSDARTYINLIIVFFLTGIWHGASWTFIIWGIMHGLLRLMERFIQKNTKISMSKHKTIKLLCAKVYLLFFVNIGWVLFRAPNMKQAIEFISAMFGKTNMDYCGITAKYYLTRWNLAIFVIAVFFCTRYPRILVSKILNKQEVRKRILIKDFVMIIMLMFSIMAIVTNTYKSFIYFQF